MQELYNPATFLDSTCFSELNQPSNNSCDSSYYNFPSYFNFNNQMAGRQRKMEAIPQKRIRDPPFVAGMQATPIPPLGCTTQHRFLSEAIAPTVERSVAPLFLQAGQLPGRRADSTILNSVLSMELKDDTIIASDTFIDRLFPTERAPFPIDSILFKALAKKGFWNAQTLLLQGLEYSEVGMASWLNNVGKTMGEVYGCSLKRLWWHGTCNLPPSGAPINRKPDLVLLSREYHDTMTKILNVSIGSVSALLLKSHRKKGCHQGWPTLSTPNHTFHSYSNLIVALRLHFHSASLVNTGSP
jgi:hypothetical protein